ncbi:MAG TPA: GGDEF domain-containing protein, partial [Coriobacteriia bacterium]|nr:GGDEF domain-containing protein [Coriobacteriia bacterium]
EFRRELSTRASQTILDNATGLFSRGYFMRAYPAELQRAQRAGRAVHALLLDLDQFGAFNERFGIDAGDRLLVSIAHAISATVVPSADVASSNLVRRIGGEEFGVLYAEDDDLSAPPRPEDAMALAEKIRAAVQETRVDGAGVTVSIGVASLGRDASTGEELLDAADAALSCAIEDGGNQVFAADKCRLRASSASAPVADES